MASFIHSLRHQKLHNFLPSHELEVTFEQTNKLPTLFIFPPTIHN